MDDGELLKKHNNPFIQPKIIFLVYCNINRKTDMIRYFVLKSLIMLKKIPYIVYYILFFIIFIFSIYYDATHHQREVSIAVGKKNGAYYVYAKQYQRLLKKYDVKLTIVETNGAAETQEKLINNEVDFAFLQGGLERTNEGILALANVAHEPIWVLYRDTRIKKFEDLKGKRINICNPQSGTYPVAKKLLVELLDMKESDLQTKQMREAFPLLMQGKLDAVFYIIARSSESLQKKIHTEGIHILNFGEADSIRKSFIKDDMNSSKNDYFKTIMVKKRSIDFVHNIPKQDKKLLVKRTILGTKNASDELVRLFLKVAQKVHSKEAFFHEENHFLSTHGLKYRQHVASKQYFTQPTHRYESSALLKSFSPQHSYWIAQSLKKIEDIILIFIVPLALIGFFIEVLYPIIKIFTRRKINRWYRKINKLDTNMEDFSLEELYKNKRILEEIAIEIYNTDNIDATHLEPYYTVQNQVKNMIENFEHAIAKKKESIIIDS